MRLYFGFACMVLLCAVNVAAQDKTPPAAAPPATASAPKSASPTADNAEKKNIDPEKEKDIRQLLELAGTKVLMTQAMGEMEKSTRPALENMLPAGEYREKLIEAFFVKFREKFNVQRMINLAVPIYDKYFSHEEVKGLIKFYETPLGQKSISVLPQLTAELMSEGRQVGEEAGRQSMMEALAEHPELQKQMEEAQKANQQ
jgi:uncharacterized protein